MSQKLSYRELEMDVLEQLYYQRKAERLESFAKKRNCYRKNRVKQGSDIFDSSQK